MTPVATKHATSDYQSGAVRYPSVVAGYSNPGVAVPAVEPAATPGTPERAVPLKGSDEPELADLFAYVPEDAPHDGAHTAVDLVAQLQATFPGVLIRQISGIWVALCCLDRSFRTVRADSAADLAEGLDRLLVETAEAKSAPESSGGTDVRARARVQRSALGGLGAAPRTKDPTDLCLTEPLASVPSAEIVNDAAFPELSLPATPSCPAEPVSSNQPPSPPKVRVNGAADGADDVIIRQLRHWFPQWQIDADGDQWTAKQDGWGVLKGKTPAQLWQRLDLYAAGCG